MRRLLIKFPSQIRISGWDFGSSARAMNQAGGKDSLMTYESVPKTQADLVKVMRSTTERKSMSTKTSIKRIALVAVAALGLGAIASVSPANAANVYVEGSFSRVSFVTPTSAGSTSVESSAIINIGGACSNAGASGGDTIIVQQTYYVSIVSAPATSNLAANSVYTVPAGGNDYDTTVPTGYTQVNGTAYTISSQNFASGQDYAARVMGECTDNSKAMSVYSKVRFTPDKAGTYVIAAIPADNSATRATATWTVTVTAPTTASATAFISTSTDSAPTADTAATSRVASATASATPRARITVRQYSSSDTSTAIVDGYASAVTATVSGAGILGAANDGSNRSSLGFSKLAAGSGIDNFYLYSDGRTGPATITIKVGSLTITKTFTFYGTLAAYDRSADDDGKSLIGVGETDVLNIVGKDSTGNLTASANTIYAKSSDATIASVSVASQAVTVTGNKSGTATITVCDTPSCLAATITKTFDVKVTKTTAASFTLSFDKDEYLPGEKMTITVKALDSNGAGVADGSRNLFSSAGITSNVSLTGASWTASAAVVLAAGVKTYTVYAPLVAGTVSVMATQGAAVDAVIAGGTAAVVSASANVAYADGGTSAAIDAANEATDAANAATDAANAAAEAADAATAAAQDAQAAVAELATQVAALIAGIKAQITTLTNLVIKIQKKVKA